MTIKVSMDKDQRISRIYHCPVFDADLRCLYNGDSSVLKKFNWDWLNVIKMVSKYFKKHLTIIKYIGKHWVIYILGVLQIYKGHLAFKMNYKLKLDSNIMILII